MIEILTPEESARINHSINGALVFDGDGDGASAAALYARSFHSTQAYTPAYVAITNKQKGDRSLVKRVFDFTSSKPPIDSRSPRSVAVFDISAEQNLPDLERLVNSGASVDFFDHHTQIALPEGIKNYAKPDSRDTSTVSIVYETILGNLSAEEKSEAARLAIIGLANDGKDSAASRLAQGILSEDEIKKIIDYGHALNYAANKENRVDFAQVAKALSQSPSAYLQSREIADLYTERKEALAILQSKLQKHARGDIAVYGFPYATEEEAELSRAAYPEVLNGVARDNLLVAGVINLGNGKYRVSVRGRDALKQASKAAEHYGAKAMGRETAAGFDSERTITPSELLQKLEV